jgi:hypothetical protein
VFLCRLHIITAGMDRADKQEVAPTHEITKDSVVHQYFTGLLPWGLSYLEALHCPKSSLENI